MSEKHSKLPRQAHHWLHSLGILTSDTVQGAVSYAKNLWHKQVKLPRLSTRQLPRNHESHSVVFSSFTISASFSFQTSQTRKFTLSMIRVSSFYSRRLICWLFHFFAQQKKMCHQKQWTGRTHFSYSISNTNAGSKACTAQFYNRLRSFRKSSALKPSLLLWTLKLPILLIL